MSEFMTVQEVAALLKISLRQVYKLKDNAGLPYRKIGGSIRILKSELEDWVKNQK